MLDKRVFLGVADLKAKERHAHMELCGLRMLKMCVMWLPHTDLCGCVPEGCCSQRLLLSLWLRVPLRTHFCRVKRLWNWIRHLGFPHQLLMLRGRFCHLTNRAQTWKLLTLGVDSLVQRHHLFLLGNGNRSSHSANRSHRLVQRDKI